MINANSGVERYYTIGTAGHVDHGKSALVWKLTGINPDRLAEEMERGMSIELGFVFLTLPQIGNVAIIDVPGHERFLRTTVAGIWGIDLAMLVIAADEGPMPQTLEHLEAMQYLGVERGLIVLNKKDLVNEEWLLLMQEEVEKLVRGTFLEGAPVVSVSARTGEGVDELQEMLAQLLLRIDDEEVPSNLRLPIDRVFTLKGFGTVVAGTVAGGEIKAGDEVELLPVGRRLRVRNVQTHNSAVEEASRGQRAALNLPAISVEDIRRGYELARPGTMIPTRRLGVKLHLSIHSGISLPQRARLRLHKGTAEVICRVVLLDREILHPGESCLCHLVLEYKVVAQRYENFVIRGFSTLRIIGGGRIVDPYAQYIRRRRQQEVDRLAEVEHSDLRDLVLSLLKHGYRKEIVLKKADLLVLTFQPDTILDATLRQLIVEGLIVETDGRYIHHDVYKKLLVETETICKHTLKTGRMSGVMSSEEVRNKLDSSVDLAVMDHVLKELTEKGVINYAGGMVSLPEGGQAGLTPDLQSLLDKLLKLYDPNSFTLLSLPEITKKLGVLPGLKKLIAYLVAKGSFIWLREGLLARKEDMDRAWKNVQEILEAQGQLRVADWKDIVGLGRKDATAILDYFVEEGLTIRVEGTHRLVD